MTILLSTIYFIGLAIMAIGYFNAPDRERAESQPVLAIAACLFWPVTVAAVIGHVVVERLFADKATTTPFSQMPVHGAR